VESQISKKTIFKNTPDDGFYKSSGKDANNISTKASPSHFSKDITSHQNFYQHSTSTPKSPAKTSSTKYFQCLGFGHIASNCPSKRTIMLQEVNQDQTQIKTKRENEKAEEVKRVSSC